MDSTKRAIKYQYKESKNGILKFWLVMIAVIIFGFFMNKYTDVKVGVNGFEEIMNGSLSIMMVNFLPIIIYLSVYSYEMYYKQFPLALAFSITRKDFYKSMVINNIGIAFIFALIQSVLLKIDPMLVKAAGRRPIYDVKVFSLEYDSLIFIVVSLFIAFITFMTLWNLIAVLNYKLGPILWIGIGVISFVTTLFMGFNIFDLIFPGKWLNARLDLQQSFIMLGINLVMYIIIYFTLINTNIKRSK